ncbi:hypothetical protein FIV38_22885 [Pseudomonas proteolytica]|nr:hypothetical protein F4W61_15150 [Pseudomonas proteolytica]TWR76662.1 hypothetical protein FIV38_22885 [Pseudomonas proteolytica]
MDRRLLTCVTASTRCAWTWFPVETLRCVGAGLPAKIVNGDAGCLGERGVWASFAGKPAPTRGECRDIGLVNHIVCN